MNIEKTAYEIYRAAYGKFDDKNFRAEKQGEIEDWLNDGDLDGSETTAELIEMWGDYVAQADLAIDAPEGQD